MATGTKPGSVFLPRDAEAWPKPSAPAQRNPARQFANQRLSKSLPRPASEDAASTDASSTAPPDSLSQPDSDDVLVDIDPAEGRRRGEHLMSMLHMSVSTAEKSQSQLQPSSPVVCLRADALLPPPPWQQTPPNAPSNSYAGGTWRVRRTFIDFHESPPTPGRLRCKSAPAMLRFYGADSNAAAEWGVAKDIMDGNGPRSLLALAELSENQLTPKSHTFNKYVLPFIPHCQRGMCQALHAYPTLCCGLCRRAEMNPAHLSSAPKEPQPNQSSVPEKYVVCTVPAGWSSPMLSSCRPGPLFVQLSMAEVQLTPEDQMFNVASLPQTPRNVVLIDAEAKPEDHAKLSEEARAATVVAFDAEWKPDLDGSDNSIAVLQLAFPDTMAVYVVHVAALGGFPTDVEEMMGSPNVKKIGFAIGQDLRKFKTSNLTVNDKSMSDVRDDCLAALGIGSTVSLGLAWAAQEILWYEMKKIKEVTCSNWASQRLTIEQIEYAAMDAWVTLRLYQALRSP